MGVPSGPSVAAFQAATPNEFRGRVAALYYFCINLIGAGAGALAVGLVSDCGLRSEQQLGWSMAAVAASAGPLAALCLWRARSGQDGETA